MTGELIAYGAGPLLDPDCRDGKHGSCVGPPCECDCHATPDADRTVEPDDEENR